MDTSVIVYLSLWDDVAATFHAHLSSSDTMNSVMLVTTVNPKMFGGNLYLNSTTATRFFFDTDIQPIQQFSNRMGIKSEEAFTRADTSAGMRKKELVSIHELHEFISKSHEQTQDADFLCNAKVLGVVRKNGWSYVSCTGCSRKLDKVGNALRCNKCVSPTVTGVVRYRVELAVEDGHDRATFIVFDDEMTKLITKTAATLILEDGDGGNKDEIPSCIEDLNGKQFLFQIKVTPFNFTSSHRTFTVSKLSESTTDVGQSATTIEGPTFNVKVDNSASSNIVQTLDNKLDESTNSNMGMSEKKRKRGCE
ncbi:PREDICTED: uncharacterized protein LOC104787882 [Camelina sativa]|uniref:Uncharacterized protein LOC104787882 n=1 Tax=Camelina sativa TaxID=90675 RepID=A0ABM0Z8A6_CAMSA|nr:PREDICTED: uncharacterized protein LOC104787882 [Camelina sativa]XP_010511836.1 PREDICTED: uncharacterized protein LOC104787882 [Camelina sativa]XP_010511837.1 PREDICTED: uncharacterized protein LOC104787882 [Camelina sativa]